MPQVRGGNKITIHIYGRHTSYNVQKVLWLLEELEIDYLHTELGSNPDDTGTDAFVRMNPMRKVPVLLDNDRVIWESNTILRYLVNSYGDKVWRKADAYEISEYERWMDWAQTLLEPAFVDVFWGYYRTPAASRDMGRIEGGIALCNQCLARIGEQLQGKSFLLGEQLSLADIATGVFLHRLTSMGLDIPLPENVAVWFGRLQGRKAYRKWVMSDFSMLYGRLAY